MNFSCLWDNKVIWIWIWIANLIDAISLSWITFLCIILWSVSSNLLCLFQGSVETEDTQIQVWKCTGLSNSQLWKSVGDKPEFCTRDKSPGTPCCIHWCLSCVYLWNLVSRPILYFNNLKPLGSILFVHISNDWSAQHTAHILFRGVY